ncbi:phage tail protein [Pseudomonas sp. NPDC089554]|uniref:phage tail protein n=1 Tax=Pseudomonas sp. NPDC089554 TaxID=3390653 RepID=UPI003D00C746
MSEPFLGEIIIFGGNFAPRGWAFCQGQLLSVAQNTALFSILGTTYGGNGQTTFGLPDMRGRSPIGAGQGPGLTPIELGEQAGTEQVTLTSMNVPPVTVNMTQVTVPVAIPVAIADSNLAIPSNASVLGKSVDSAGTGATVDIYSSEQPTTTLAPFTARPTGAAFTSGGNVPIEIRSPYLGVNYIIATAGLFPSRN